MITIMLTEAEAARICYALEGEAAQYSRQIRDEINNGAFSAWSGGIQRVLENGRDECMGIVRRIQAEMER